MLKRRYRRRNRSRTKYKTDRGDVKALWRVKDLRNFDKFTNGEEHIKAKTFPLKYAYSRYKGDNKCKYTQGEYGNVIRNILRCITYLWVHSTGGVYVKHLGYFAVSHDRSKKPRGFWKDDSVNEGVFSLIHDPISNSRLKGYTITTPHEDSRIELYKNVVNGKRYFNYSDYVRNLFSINE